MNVQSYLQTRTKTAVTLFALGLTVLLGALDYWVKPQFSVSIFYLLPVALAAWFGGTQALVGIAVFWVVAWLVNGSLHSLAPFPLPVPWWDAVVQILFGFVLALLLTRLKALSTTVEQQVADRTASLTAAIAERQRLEAAAKLQFAQLVLDKMWDPAFWVGPAGRFIYVNDAACRQLGYSRTELLARGVSDIDPSLSAEQWAQVWRTMQTEKYRVFEQRQRTKDGRILPVELAVSYLENEGDEYLVGIVRDLTERQQVEQALFASEERLRLILNHSRDLVYRRNLQTDRYDFVSPAITELIGYTMDEVVGASVQLALADVHPADRPRVQAALHRAQAGQETGGLLEYRFRHRDGQYRWLSDRYTVLPDATGHPLYWLGVSRDVTASKQLEQSLRASEDRLKMFGETTFEGIIESEAGRILDCNEQYARISGYSVAELRGMEIAQLVVPEERDRVLENVRQNREALTEHAMVRKDGTRIIVETHGYPVAPGSPRRHTALRDITRRKQVELALQESEGRFRALFEQAADAIVVFDPETLVIVEFNDEACRRLGYTRAEFAQLTIPDVDALEDARAVRRHVQEIPVDSVIEFETKQRTKTGAVLDIVVRTRRIRMGATTLVQAIWTDITERNRVQAALREQQVKLELAVTGSKGIPWEVPVDWAQPEQFPDTALSNPRLIEFIGFRDDEFPHSVAAWFERIHPDDVIQLQASARDRLAGRVAAPNIEYRIRHKDGSWRWISSQHQLFRDSHGRPVRWSGIDWDITERKQAEVELERLVQERTQALAETRQLFRDIFDSSTDAIGYADLAGRLLNANPAFATLTGYTVAELQRLNFRQITPPEYAETDQQAREAILRTGKTQRFEKEYVRKDGTRVPVAETVFAVRNSAGQLTGTAVSVRDITEQRRLQRQILEISDAEQNRIGRDLHDSLCQMLTGVTFALGALEERLASHAEPVARAVHEISELVRGANAEARQIARGLYPVELANGSLPMALQRLADDVARAGTARCELLCDPEVAVPDPVQALHMYRIVQEAVANALRHGAATTIVIVLKAAAGQLLLEVANNGRDWPDTLTASGGMGLNIMAYRARMMGGTLQICRGTAGGTLVELSFPITRPV